MITIYTNGDIISFDEHEKTYSVLIEEKGKIVYVGYNIPICYDNEKIIDLENKAIIPVINRVISINAPQAVCSVLKEGENADFAILDKNILNEGGATILDVFVSGKNINEKRRNIFKI